MCTIIKILCTIICQLSILWCTLAVQELDLDNSWFTGVDTSFDLNEFLGYGRCFWLV